MDVDKSSDLFGGSNDAEKSSDLFGGSNMGSGTSSDLFGEPTTSTDKSAAWQYHQPSVACRSSSSSFSADTVQSALHTNSPSLAAVDPRMGDPEYESSVELARKLQDEFDRCARADADAESVRRPDESYTECLLPDVPQGAQFDQSDVDLQRAIAKSLIDM
ncbi:conserved hypothetical protein [Theileria equi strain WA]|uniref:Uncharacterized protein n=1 Tax=Theileria equi strain WA TaxID=1537102 RepID=L1LEL3_THEEQ|nr:conserved hypothetical protein [Theileria equi strain WA]EKX73618.1 conserved hypothetical protein [Theileria equi strain WA]|eukprot:XP_004833070.1 conserved hypothetical protein [Theileria equi strain WA]